MNQAQTKLSIIIITCIIHLLVLLWLFIFYHDTAHQFNFTPLENSVQIPETVFYDPQQEQQNPSQTQTPSPQMPQQESFNNEWGQLNQRAGNLGASMEQLDEDLGPDTQEDEASADEDESQLDPSIRTESATQDVYPEAHMVSDRNAIVSNHNAQTILSNEINSPSVEFNSQAQSASKDSKTQKKSAQKEQKLHAQKTMAKITRGYLEQLNSQGNDLIQTYGGDPNKKPTAQQLKEQHYVAKIVWCFQNAQKIHDKLNLDFQMETVALINLTVDQDGKMVDLHIVKSSGNTMIDKHFLSLFKYASSSFPPLPTYIKAPYTIPFRVIISERSLS